MAGNNALADALGLSLTLVTALDKLHPEQTALGGGWSLDSKLEPEA